MSEKQIGQHTIAFMDLKVGCLVAVVYDDGSSAG
jgi:hypothetical protein